jgi:hypothetical protein
LTRTGGFGDPADPSILRVTGSGWVDALVSSDGISERNAVQFATHMVVAVGEAERLAPPGGTVAICN